MRRCAPRRGSARLPAGSGLYDVRVSGADGDTVAEFRGHTRIISGKVLPEADPAVTPDR